MADNSFTFPEPSEHTTIIGRTGSGKTQGGAWLLSHANFDEMPYVIVDSKGDELLNSIGAQHYDFNADPPERPGLYITHPLPKIDDEAMENFMWEIHRKTHTGLYFDEGFMYAKSNALEAILTQGRSKNIPVTTLTQRPSWISRYAFSEASHFMVFHLNDRRDRVKVREFFEQYNQVRLNKYHSQWYNVNHDRNFILRPVENAGTIRARFEQRLEEMRERKNHKIFI